MNAPLRIPAFPSTWIALPESLLRFVTARAHIKTGDGYVVERWTHDFGESCVMTTSKGMFALDIDAIGNDEPCATVTEIRELDADWRERERRLLNTVSGIVTRGDREADRREYAEQRDI